MPYTYDLEWLNNKPDHKKVWEYKCMSDVHQIIILFLGFRLDVELCPETGNSYIVVIKLWF